MTELAVSSSPSDPLIHLWDIRTGVLAHSLKGNSSQKHSIAIINGHFLSPQYILACQSEKSIITIWSFQKQASICKFVVQETLNCIACSHSGLFVVAGGVSGRCYLWELESGRLVRMWDAHYQKVTILKFSSDDERIVSGGFDSSINCYSLLE